MDRKYWKRIEELFEQAQSQPVNAQRRFLSQACANDVVMSAELEAMLIASLESTLSP